MALRSGRRVRRRQSAVPGPPEDGCSWSPRDVGDSRAGKLTEETEHERTVLRPSLGDRAFVRGEIGQPLVEAGQCLAEIGKVGGWDGEQADRLVVEVPGRSNCQPSLDIEGSRPR